MNDIKLKNYIYVILLILLTFFLTILLAKNYINKNKIESVIYKYANSISINEFDEYIVENPDTIIYISNKYDLSNESFEKKFVSKIESLNLKSKLVFIDLRDVDKNFIKKLKYNNKDTNIESMIVLFIDGNIENSIIINDDINVNDFIDYEVFR